LSPEKKKNSTGILLKIKTPKRICWLLKIEARGFQTFQLADSEKSPRGGVDSFPVHLRLWQLGSLLLLCCELLKNCLLITG